MSEQFFPYFPSLGDWRAKTEAYEAARKLRREQWAISDAEDFCVRKEVEPGSYKPLWWNEVS